MAIVSVSGLIGSGKNAVAEYLVKEHQFTQMSFAGSLKDAVSAIFGWDRVMLEGSTKEAREERERVDEWWATRLGIPGLTPRWVLQYFGTDVCRNHFHNDIWLSSLENALRKNPTANVVVSDSRFVNELDMLRRVNGILVKVDRGPKPDWWEVAEKAHRDPAALLSMQQSGIHQSEWDWAGYEFDCRLGNNGTLDDLYRLVEVKVLKNLR